MLKTKHKIAIALLNLISKTWRIRTNGLEPKQAPAIIAFWHGQMLPVWRFFAGRNPIGVVSLSRDGEVLSQLLVKWGFSLIRGSSSRKGREVLEEICSSAQNHFVLITPDGPRGPIHKFKPGAAVAAQRTGAPLYFCKVSIKSKKVFPKSWDKFEVPLPFSKINLEFSEAIYIDKHTDRDGIEKLIDDYNGRFGL